MGVVITTTTKSHYHTHRILLPNGSVFTFEIKKVEPTPAEAAPNAESSPISSTESILSENSENVNEKFSQEPMTLAQLKAENRKFKKQLEYWRNRSTMNPKKTVREGDVKKLAKAIVESVPTDIKPHEIVPDLMELGNYILNEKELRYTEVHDMAASVLRIDM